MVLVLCGHLQNDIVFSFSPYIRDFCKWIFSFHMPLFFAISGMLFASKGEIPELPVFFKKRFQSIMIPYYLFSTVYFLVIIYGVFFSHSMDTGDMFLQLWYAASLHGINVLWFLPTLFFAEMIFAFAAKRFEGKKRWLFFIILVLAAVLANEARALLPDGVPFYDRLDEIIVTLIRPVIASSFIFAGYSLKRAGEGPVPGVMVPCFFVISIVVVRFNAPNDLRSMVLNNYVLYYIGAMAGSGFVIRLCRMLMSLSKSGRAFPVLRFFGRNSLLFMAVHNNSIVWIWALQISMLVNRYVTRARGYISYAVIVLVFLIYVFAMILIIGRFAPVLAGKKRKR